ncbi:PhrA family phosphatase inhibitor [Bacillus atrophaeus]|uniref:Secreted inhibitor of the activity of phosphatase RapA n=1 Tax=Bacillus atrophaeus (strain 1942) TaxID=720555 RepID=A0ABM5LVH4_BACA1|nr:PhrA family phosphatase inhibitor [Bacillus atrophaeus]ADP31726.1 secreted inhibitor of the activity of phosphatase RapA [Bacillus atrophaeus 1942]AIK48331.1 putative phosphatase rapA inhibitor [Bacillus atrophaeus subsp. globigii]EIM10272.1 secreted inhibitor of the activity of phosphatase RapA [Bacillus atrophaeus C89]KFK83995.1 putative phosphatase rapA inhibitor [Bacillus atrophaeus]MBG9759261.1 phosphatase [Bacillus atrophaeus]
MKSKLMTGLLLVAVGFSFTQVMPHTGETADKTGNTFDIAARNQT